MQQYKENEKKLKQKVEELKVNFLNITNDLSVCRNDMLTYENQLNNERDKIKHVKEENKRLIQKVSG